MVVPGLVAIVNMDVIARGAFHAPFRGAVEVVQFSMVLIVFLQLPDVVRANRLTRSDGLLFLIRNKYPFISQCMRRAIDLLSGFVMLLVAIAIWPEWIEMWETQDYFGIPGVFTAKWWPVKLTIFASAALCSLIFFLKVLRLGDTERLAASVGTKAGTKDAA